MTAPPSAESAEEGAGETDEELVRAFAATRAADVFETLVMRHLPSMRRVLFAVLNGNLEEVAEAEQEVLVALHRDLTTFAFRASFRTWLYRFTRNRAIDYLRAARRRRLKDLRIARLLPPDPPRDPEEEALREERRAGVLRALAGLNAKDRLIVTLRDVEGLDMEQIGAVLDVAVGTVKSRLSRARVRLARLLREEGVCDG